MPGRNPLSHMERFVNWINVSNSDCWEWQGETIKGYGRYRIENIRIMAHRFSYMVYKSDIPEGLYIDHLCRNTICVNPDHLEAVTAAENQRRSTWREAMNRIKGKYKKTTCKWGHSFLDPANVYIFNNGQRACKTCSIARANANWPKQNARRKEMRRLRRDNESVKTVL